MPSPGGKGEWRKSALQTVSADFTLFPWKSCGCRNSCPQAGTTGRRGIYSNKWWWLILSCHGKCFCTLMSENCIIIVGLIVPRQSCVCSQDTKWTQRAFWLAPRSLFWWKGKRNAAKPARTSWDPQGKCNTLTHQPTSLFQAGSSPNYSPLILWLSR